MQFLSYKLIRSFHFIEFWLLHAFAIIWKHFVIFHFNFELLWYTCRFWYFLIHHAIHAKQFDTRLNVLIVFAPFIFRIDMQIHSRNSIITSFHDCKFLCILSTETYQRETFCQNKCSENDTHPRYKRFWMKYDDNISLRMKTKSFKLNTFFSIVFLAKWMYIHETQGKNSLDYCIISRAIDLLVILSSFVTNNIAYHANDIEINIRLVCTFGFFFLSVSCETAN